LKLMETAFKRALAAGIPLVFGSGSTSPSIPHGKQGNQFAYFVKWGMSPAAALQTPYLPAAQMLNYGWERDIATLEKGKFADVIAVSGNPLVDPTEMERVKFVMKGGIIAKDDLTPAAVARTQ
jgi:imidazolonepropionase-like amidohydrolase